MTLEQDQLDEMLNKTIIVAMVDGGRFRGILNAVGDKVIVLNDVVELAEHGKWVKPIVSTASFEDIVTSTKTMTTLNDRAALDRVLIYKKHILRIWPWEPKNIGAKEMAKNY
jgi:small nuclear ribonucleoprotein (snRNP)-like protein